MPHNVFGLLGSRSSTFASNLNVDQGRVDCDFHGQIYLSVRNTSNTEASLVKTGQRIAQITFVVTPLFNACESVLIPQARLVDLYKTRSPASNSGYIARFLHGSVFESRLLSQMSTEWSAWFSPKMKDNMSIEG